MSKVILFTFAGRKANLEIQLPLIRRILDQHPEARFDIWNLARTAEDDEYVRSIAGERISVRNDFYSTEVPPRFNSVWQHYLDPQYRDDIFVKFDDDVIFIETERFGDFVQAVKDNPNKVISAQVINNGACGHENKDFFRRSLALEIPLLDVHLSGEYAALSHEYAFENWDTLVGQPINLVPTKTWLSINLIGFDFRMLHSICDGLGRNGGPHYIAGRTFRRLNRLGDEGSVNRYPRVIMEGFLAAHLTFGPQVLPEDQWDGYRKRYAELGERYLETT